MTASLRIRSASVAVVLLAALTGPLATPADAVSCDKTWNGGSGDWSVDGNWTPFGVPSSMDTVCITAAGTYTVTLKGSQAAEGITLGAPSGTQTLVLEAGGDPDGPGGVTNAHAVLVLDNQGTGSSGVLANGAIVLTASHSSFTAHLNGDLGEPLANAGTITVDPGVGGDRWWEGEVNNTGTININASLNPFVPPGPWTNSGAINVAASQTLPVTGFTWSSGTITNNGAISLSGTVSTGTGTLSGNPIELYSAAVSPTGTGSASFLVRTSNTLASNIASGYTLNVQGSAAGHGQLTFTTSRTNNGTILLTSTHASFYAHLEGTGAGTTLTNAGTITVDPGGNATRLWYGAVNNTGTININTTLNSLNVGPWTNSGAINVAVAGILPVAGFTWSSGPITNNGSISLSGTVSTGTGTLSGNPIELYGATFSPTGAGSASFLVRTSNTLASDIASGYTLTIQGSAAGHGQLTFTTSRTNNGTILLTSTHASFYAHLEGTEAGTTLTNAGTITVDPGANATRLWYGAVNNTGAININESVNPTSVGPWTSSGTVTVASGTTLPVGGSGLTLTGGTLRGTGTVAANVTNTGGTVRPGTSPGILSITGDYTQGAGGTLAAEIGGLTAGTQHDRLAISGTATLGGTLAITTINAFSPSLAEEFVILTHASRTGTFSTVTGHDAGTGLVYSPTYGTTDTKLVVTADPTLSINDVTLAEGDSATTSFVFTVTRAGATGLSTSVDYSTAGGTASAPSDYQATNGTLNFAPGDTSETITVLVNGDTAIEADETFFVNLTNAYAATVTDAQALGTITNDDASGGGGPPPPPPPGPTPSPSPSASPSPSPSPSAACPDLAEFDKSQAESKRAFNARLRAHRAHFQEGDHTLHEKQAFRAKQRRKREAFGAKQSAARKAFLESLAACLAGQGRSSSS
jgi:hypothetical protein